MCPLLDGFSSAIRAKRGSWCSEQVAAIRAFRAVGRKSMVPNRIRIRLAESGNLKKLLAGFKLKRVHCLLKSNLLLLSVILDALGVHIKEWCHLTPLIISEHRNRHVASPAMVGLWHASRFALFLLSSHESRIHTKQCHWLPMVEIILRIGSKTLATARSARKN